MVENHHSFTDYAGSSEGKELERELRRLFKGDFTGSSSNLVVLLLL